MTNTKFNVVETDVAEYTASNGEFIKSSGDKVSLPSPEQDAVVAVRDTGQRLTLETPAGLIIDNSEKAVRSSETIYLVSDGQDWFSVDGRELLGGVIPDSGDLHTIYIAGEQSESDSQTVDPYVDQGGSENLAATGDPTLQESALNGEDVVRYDGNDFHQASGSIISQPLQITAVAQLDTVGTTNKKLNSGATSANRCLIQSINEEWAIFAGNVNIEGGNPDTDPHVFNAYFDGPNSYLRLDGTEILSGDTGNNDLEIATLGAAEDGGDGWTGDIPEFAIHASGLSTSAETEWEEYLGDKYGITLG